MARTSLAVTTTAAAGTVLPAAVAVDSANGNQFPNTGKELIEITNGAGANINVTVTTNGVYNVGTVQYPIQDLVVLIVNATTKVLGPFDKTLFNDPATGNVWVDYSSGTSITARVISLGAA